MAWNLTSSNVLETILSASKVVSFVTSGCSSAFVFPIFLAPSLRHPSWTRSTLNLFYSNEVLSHSNYFSRSFSSSLSSKRRLVIVCVYVSRFARSVVGENTSTYRELWELLVEDTYPATPHRYPDPVFELSSFFCSWISTFSLFFCLRNVFFWSSFLQYTVKP